MTRQDQRESSVPLTGFEDATHALRNGDLESGAVMFRHLRDGAAAAGDHGMVSEVEQFIAQLPSTLSPDELAIFQTYFDHPERVNN